MKKGLKKGFAFFGILIFLGVVVSATTGSSPIWLFNSGENRVYLNDKTVDNFPTVDLGNGTLKTYYILVGWDGDLPVYYEYKIIKDINATADYYNGSFDAVAREQYQDHHDYRERHWAWQTTLGLPNDGTNITEFNISSFGFTDDGFHIDTFPNTDLWINGKALCEDENGQVYFNESGC